MAWLIKLTRSIILRDHMLFSAKDRISWRSIPNFLSDKINRRVGELYSCFQHFAKYPFGKLQMYSKRYAKWYKRKLHYVSKLRDMPYLIYHKS